jgi:NitT/TauT family transport system permease protein
MSGSSARDRLDHLASRGRASIPGALSLAVGLAAWEVCGRAWDIPFLPPVSTVLLTAARLAVEGEIAADLVNSLRNLALGYGLAVCVGVTAGLVMGRYRKAEYALGPVLAAMLASPKLLFVPVLYAAFGVSRSALVAVIFLSAVFIITANTMSGLRTVDRSIVEMALVFGASRRQLFARVLLPGSLPLTMAGLRLGMGRAVAGMITGEMFITLVGLGAKLRLHGNRFDSATVFAILLVVALVALTCTGLMRAAERRLTHWADPRA